MKKINFLAIPVTASFYTSNVSYCIFAPGVMVLSWRFMLMNDRKK